jgi:FAD/FMN-containing dehydrogenase
MLMSGWSWMAPLVGPAILGVTQLGLAASDSQVMWGPAHYLQRFVLPSTLRVSAGSQALLTRRDRVQEVVHEFATIYTDMLRLYQSRGQFPVNTCVEIRVTGVDRPDASGVAGAQPLALSAGAPHPDHPDYDTVVWLDALTAAGTPGQGAFYAELERKLRDRLGPLGVLRPEWSKRFAHTASGGAWTNTEDFGQRIPAAFPQFAAAQEAFARYDPKGVFRSTMLGKLGL